MNKTIYGLKYGGVAGAILILGWLTTSFVFNDNPENPYDFRSGEIVGYIAMSIALTMVFFGIRRYRKKALGGYIKFRQGLLVGLQIVAVTTIIYVAGWMIYYPAMMPDFAQQYADYQIAQYHMNGVESEEMLKKTQEMKEWVAFFKDPYIMAGITLLEIFPFGMLVTFISAFALRKKS